MIHDHVQMETYGQVLTEIVLNLEMCQGQIVVDQIIIATHQVLIQAEVIVVEVACLVHLLVWVQVLREKEIISY